jgi:putative ABC transport system ATP-binding protein
VAITGPSGSGKSTMLGLMAGLDNPSTGRIILDGTDITVIGEERLARLRGEKVGIVFQFFHLIPSLTALENVMVPIEITGARDAAVRARALLEDVGLADRGHHLPSQLSGGEQQRVAIARAVAKQPAVLLCDEPTGALDISTGIVVLEALAQVNAELGTTTVVITHNAAIAQMSDRVVRLADGRVTSVEVNTSKIPPHALSW